MLVNRGRVAAIPDVLQATDRKGADAVDDSIRGRRKAMISQVIPAINGQADWGAEGETVRLGERVRNMGE